MSIAERISLWLAQMRAASRAVFLARLVVLMAGAVALAVSGLQPWDQLDLIPLIAVPMLLATVALPDSPAALVFILVVAVGWLMRAPGEISRSLVLTGIAFGRSGPRRGCPGLATGHRRRAGARHRNDLVRLRSALQPGLELPGIVLEGAVELVGPRQVDRVRAGDLHRRHHRQQHAGGEELPGFGR